MKVFIVILLSLLLSFSAQAQIITFTAVDNQTDEPIELDSIKIYTDNMAWDTVITDMQFDLGLHTSVDSDIMNNLIEPLSANPFEDEYVFRVNSEYPVQIQVTDLTGSYSFSYTAQPGVHSIDGSKLSFGMYILSARTPNRSKTIKLMKSGTGDNQGEIISSIAEENTISSTPEEFVYTFIGYKYGYVHHELSYNTFPENMEVNFRITDLAPNTDWYFSKMEFSIVVHNVIKKYTHYDVSLGTKVSRDTVTISHNYSSNKFSYGISQMYCFSIATMLDTLTSFIEYKDNGGSGFSRRDEGIKFIIDDINEMITDLHFRKCTLFSNGYTQSYEGFYFFRFQDLNFSRFDDRFEISLSGANLFNALTILRYKYEGGGTAMRIYEEYTFPEEDPEAEMKLILWF